MLGYVLPAIAGAASAAIASVLAAQGLSLEAAWVSAACAVLLAIEKTLSLREKWHLHVGLRSQFEVLYLELLSKQIQPKQAIDELKILLRNYASSLPIAPRSTDNDAQP